MIPSRFTKDFIIESVLFILNNNNSLFDNELHHQETGTGMGTKFAPHYACLCIGYLEETKLFPVLLPNHFDMLECQYIENNFFRFIDDGFITWPTTWISKYLRTY